ncbi:alpha/beta hydrolase [Pararhizobium haloflavum]|uniref:alpha/beta hydrolase n=1 Tax=Pararhizobium haloflavum TaxID=2037914 RepID=UPI001FDEDBEE|nr:alpha/beta fold hydrolase [Pararhizobium haloflavum]
MGKKGRAMQLSQLRVLVGFACALLVAPNLALAQSVAPFKDRLFAYPEMIDQRADGRFQRYAYDEARDIDRRDSIPEKRVDPAYVDLSVRRQQRAGSVAYGQRNLEFYEVGAAQGADFAVIFIHGRGGDRRLGVDDWTFGGNFNRLKNLAVKNDGTYYAPSVPDFGTNGTQAVSALIRQVAKVSPGAPIILACGSMGSLICWRAADDAAVSALLDGLVILGGTAHRAFTQSPAMRLRVPIVFAHGSNDQVYDWRSQAALFDAVLAAAPDYRTRFALFETGSHGTPIRMTDWRETLNFIMSR